MTIPTVKLVNVAAINPRLTERPSPQELVSFLGMADVDAERGTTTLGQDKAFAETAKGYTQFADKDILVAKITPCFENGKIAQATLRRQRGSGSTEFHVIRPDRSLLDDRYLLNYLRQPYVRVVGERQMTGSAGQRRVPASFLSNLLIPMPTLSEQRRVADILDRNYAVRAKRREAITLLDGLAQAIFLDMFHDFDTAPIVRLGDQLRFVTSGGRGWARYYSARGTRFIRSLDVRMNEIDDRNAVYVTPPDNAEARRTRIQVGDVLLTITGSLIGRVAPVSDADQGSYISQHVAIIRPDKDKLVSAFLAFYLSLPSGGQAQISRMQYGQTKPGLNFDQIRDFQIPMPSLNSQETFVERLNLVRGIRAAHQTYQAGVDSLFGSLQYRAFGDGAFAGIA